MNLFCAANQSRGLEDVVNAIAEDERDVEYELIILPPGPNVLEEEEDDDLQTSELPRDVPGHIEVIRRRHSSEASESEDNEDEPLSNKTWQPNPDVLPTWRKCSPCYTSITVPSENNIRSTKRIQIVEQLKGLSPVEVFDKIFDSDIYDLILNNTLLYAEQNNKHGFVLDREDLRRFLGILILSGYHRLPRECQYWSYDEDLGVPLVARSMSRNRFLDIKRNLHLVDSSLASTTNDKMFEVRSLVESLNQKFCQNGVVHENISIDESIIKYYGHHPSKQYFKGKPVRFGYKSWVAASSDGYCYVFDLYCGKSTETTKIPLGTRVVTSLLNKLPVVPIEHNIYFNNFFSSYDLFVILKDNGFRATGTIKDGRTKKCPLTSVNDMKKCERAQFDYQFDTKNEVLLVRWKDNGVCTIGTNFDTVDPIGKVKRWCSQSRQKVVVDTPHLFQSYNKCIGGVDAMDASISMHRVSLRGKKWWWAIFTYLLDISVSNAWRLHSMSSQERFDQLDFRRHIARHYLQRNNSIKSRPSGTEIAGPCPKNNGHNPKKLPKPLRCILCHSRIRWQCSQCQRTLCMDKECFAKYHT